MPRHDEASRMTGGYRHEVAYLSRRRVYLAVAAEHYA